MFYVKTGVLRNLAKFTGKHLYQSLFLIKLAQVFSCDRGVTRGVGGCGRPPTPFTHYVPLKLKVTLPFARNPEAAMESLYQPHRYVVIIVMKYAIHLNILLTLNLTNARCV